MDSTDIVSLLEALDDNIDDVEEALSPLLQAALSDTAGRLPILDKAQLYVLVTYAIESILFSYLRLNGVNAREHPVFQELTRVKQYFKKTETAESAGGHPNAKLDKAAAGRFIKHALAGNGKYGLDRAEQQAKGSTATHIRFPGISNIPKPDPESGRESQAASSSSNCESESPETAATPSNLVESTGQGASGNLPTVDKTRKGRKRKKHSTNSDVVPKATNSNSKHKRGNGARKKQKMTELP
ncbi:hypothetical protein JMJ35_007727 [Cladonia borealis]|uniref:Exosome complex protein n=1 Tax=Cladonia borealis TaxID=184061 RepID=A0AA39QW88_9LECA|nr:hypothetical protein JMJ35_007727 [Cladonia borealis]